MISDEGLEHLLPEMVEMAYKALKEKAQVGISGCRNGACLLAETGDGKVLDMFEGCNIELSTSTVIHAERLALFHAIMKGYTMPNVIVLNTPNKTSIPMCGYCRQDYMYLNPDMVVITANANKEVTGRFILRETLVNPYMSRGKINHEQ